MANRKPVGKKLRFEVFKRDGFTCQYCGKKAPDVVLEVDHIDPVANGGENDILNLVTSCRDCNRGKGATPLSDDSAVQVQRKQMEELAERREQIEMMIRWREELESQDDLLVDSVCELIESLSGGVPNDKGKNEIRGHIEKFGYGEVREAAKIAFTKYSAVTDWEWNRAFGKIGGICYNRAHENCKQCVNFKYSGQYFERDDFEDCPQGELSDCRSCPESESCSRHRVVGSCKLTDKNVVSGQPVCDWYESRYRS